MTDEEELDDNDGCGMIGFALIIFGLLGIMWLGEAIFAMIDISFFDGQLKEYMQR